MPNCNDCQKLNITELQQQKSDGFPPHICTVYGKRVLHRSASAGYHGMLYPCYECEKDGFSRFEERVQEVAMK